MKKKPQERGKDWNATEDSVIIQKIKISPNNLAYAFEQAAEALTDRTSSSVSRRWYNYLRKDKKTGAIFGLITTKGAVANVKNVPRTPSIAYPFPMEVAMLAVSVMTYKERMEIIEKIMQMKS